jgi:hypothetical protein
MSLILYRVLFFCMVPFGIFILVKTIRMLKGVFSGEVIAEIPFTQKEVKFEIVKPGIYAIWQKGQLFRKTPVRVHMVVSQPTDVYLGADLELQKP